MVKLAVYGTLKRGFYNHTLLSGSKFLGVGTSKKRFVLGHYAYPAVVFGDSGAPIEVEIYSVTEDTLRKVDFLEGYPEFYMRDTEKFLLGGEEVEAFIYFLPDRETFFRWIEPNSDVPYRCTQKGWISVQ